MLINRPQRKWEIEKAKQKKRQFEWEKQEIVRRELEILNKEESLRTTTCAHCKGKYNKSNGIGNYCSKYCKDLSMNLKHAQKWANGEVDNRKPMTDEHKRKIEKKVRYSHIRPENEGWMRRFNSCRG